MYWKQINIRSNLFLAVIFIYLFIHSFIHLLIYLFILYYFILFYLETVYSNRKRLRQLRNFLAATVETEQT